MYLTKVDITNFACFNHFEAEFAPGVNIVIGRNGSGKTSLIKGIKYVMNFIFTNDKSMGDKYLSAGNPDLLMSSIKSYEFFRNRADDSVELESNFHGEMLFEQEKLCWDMYKKSTSGAALYPSKYVNAYRRFMEISENSGRLPLLASFSDSFPHKMTNLSSFAKKEIDNADGILQNFGYYQWDSENACTTIWQLRLVSMMAKAISLDSPDSNVRREVEYVTNKLIEFSKPYNADCDDSFQIEKIFFSFKMGEKPELWLKLKSDQEVAFNNLPAGYMRLYSMVLDLAYRSYLLNRKGDLTTSKGLVLIDEIDLHLHPSLELEVLQRFERSFPDMQIIATTHSPLVIAGIDQKNGRRQLLKLVMEGNKPEIIPDIYGIDYTSSLSDFMDTQATDIDVDYLINSIHRAFRRKDGEAIVRKLEELKATVSEYRYNRIVSELKHNYNFEDYALD